MINDRKIMVNSKRLAVFWALIPHQIIQFDDDAGRGTSTLLAGRVQVSCQRAHSSSSDSLLCSKSGVHRVRPWSDVPQDADTVNTVGYSQIPLMIEDDIIRGLASLSVVDLIGVSPDQIGKSRVRDVDCLYAETVPREEKEVLAPGAAKMGRSGSLRIGLRLIGGLGEQKVREELWSCQVRDVEETQVPIGEGEVLISHPEDVRTRYELAGV